MRFSFERGLPDGWVMTMLRIFWTMPSGTRGPLKAEEPPDATANVQSAHAVVKDRVSRGLTLSHGGRI